MEQLELMFVLLELKLRDGVGFRLSGEGIWTDRPKQSMTWGDVYQGE